LIFYRKKARQSLRTLIFINVFFKSQESSNMSKGGKRNGAGRPKGAIGLSTRAIIEAAESGGETPIAYMLRIMRDDNAPDSRRDRMARSAANFMHSKLPSIPADDEPGDADPALAAPQAEAGGGQPC